MQTLSCTVLGVFLLAVPAVGQRMMNPNAPTVGQSIQLADKGSIELSYVAISWAGGRWADALANEETRQGTREMINEAASSQPLGSMKASVDLDIGGHRVPAGSYRLGFMLDDKYKWQIALFGDGNRVDLPLAMRPNFVARKRLILSLMAGEEDFTGVMMVAFGNMVCRLPIGVSEAEEEEIPRGIINRICPIMGDPIEEDYVVLHRGYNIAFCCEICYGDWDILGTAERDEILTKILDG